MNTYRYIIYGYIDIDIDIFEKNNETEAVLLVDATNVFNSINRKALLHNIDSLCPGISIYIYNCYVVPARLFNIGGKEIQ